MTLREALFEAHVEHELARLRDEVVPARISGLVHELFLWMRTVPLQDVSSSARVVGIIRRCAVELRVGGGIVELVGEMGRLVLRSSTGEDTRLDELLPDSSYERFASKVTHLSSAWREIFERIMRTEAGELLQTQLLGWAFHELLRTRDAPVGVQRVVLGSEVRLARALAKRLRQGATGLGRPDLLALLDPELLRSVADEVWTSVAPLRLTQLFALIDEHDLEDILVLGHMFWLDFRKSPYFQRLMVEMVEHFFDKYGAQTLATLVEDMGVEEQVATRELSELLAPIVARAMQTGLLEQLVRTQLRTFYDSPACSAVLKEP